MKKKSVLIMLCLVSLFIVSSVFYHYLSQGYKNHEIINVSESHKEKMKDFEVYDIHLKKVKLSDYIGKTIVVHFWASWCPPCQREMPVFDEMVKKYGKNVSFLMINVTDGQRETKESAKEYLKKNHFEFDVFFDCETIATNTYGVLYLPRTLFINKDGYIVDDYAGELAENVLEEQINSLLQK